jgi:hypothetical protein
MPPDADLGPAALLAIALETYRSEVLPALPQDRRYAGAMAGNALEIALRGLQADAGERALLDAVYGKGKGTIAALARDIRLGRIDDARQSSLRALLKDHLRRELAVRNPRFLASRKA